MIMAKQKETKALAHEKKRASAGTAMARVHLMGETQASLHWLKVSWGTKEHSTDTNQKELT